MYTLACACAFVLPSVVRADLTVQESNALKDIKGVVSATLPEIRETVNGISSQINTSNNRLTSIDANIGTIKDTSTRLDNTLLSIFGDTGSISQHTSHLSTISTNIGTLLGYLYDDGSQRGYLYRLLRMLQSLYNDELIPYHKFIKNTFYPLVQSIKESGLSVDLSTLSDAPMRNEFGMTRPFGEILWDIAQYNSEMMQYFGSMDENLGMTYLSIRDLTKNLIHDEHGGITELGNLLTKQDDFYHWYKTQLVPTRITPIRDGVTNISAISSLMLKELQLIRTNTLHGIHIAITNSNSVIVNQAKDYKTESDKYKQSFDADAVEVQGLENRESEFMTSLGELYNPSAIPKDNLDSQGNALNSQLVALRDTIGYNTSAEQCLLSITVPRLLNPFDDTLTILRGDEGLGFYDSNTLPSSVVNFFKFMRFGFLTLYLVLLIHLTIKVSGYVLKIWHSITSLFGEKVSPSLMI